MKNLNPFVDNGSTNGVNGLGLRSDQEAASINIKVSHGPNEFVVVVPSSSSFADLKSVIAEKTGLKLETCKLLFRGKEKEDDEYLESAGVKENSKVLLVEDTPCEQEIHEEVKETPVPSKGGEAVAQVKKEVDKLSEQVSAFQATLDSGKKADEKSIIFLTEMLMRQLLKLDGIDAEREGKVQRKMEVRRVQSLVDTMDAVKLKNSNLSSNVNHTAPVTTQWENFEPAPAPVNPKTEPAPANPNTASVPAPTNPNPIPVTAPASPAPPPTIPAHAPSSPVPSPATGTVQYPVPDSSPTHVPSSSLPGTSPAMPYYTTTNNPTQSYGPSSHAPSPYAHSHYDANSSYPQPGYGAQSPYLQPGYGAHSPYPQPGYDAHSSYPHQYPPNNPYAAAPYPPAPYAAAPYPPNPYEPTHYTHNPYAPSYYNPHPMQSYNPSPMPPHDPLARPSEDPSSRASYAPSGMPSSTTVTRDWERFE